MAFFLSWPGPWGPFFSFLFRNRVTADGRQDGTCLLLPSLWGVGRGPLEVFLSSHLLLAHGLCWARHPGPEERALWMNMGTLWAGGSESREGTQSLPHADPPLLALTNACPAGVPRLRELCVLSVCLYSRVAGGQDCWF